MIDFGSLAPYVREFARLVAAELRGADPAMIPQGASGLGPRIHIAAVKRRVAEAQARGIEPTDLGAAIDGERYLLTRDAIAQEQNSRSRRHEPSVGRANAAPDGDEETAFRAALERARAARDGEVDQ